MAHSTLEPTSQVSYDALRTAYMTATLDAPNPLLQRTSLPSFCLQTTSSSLEQHTNST